jgi:dienelactone hydrolase
MLLDTLYGRWMNHWEETLCFRATNRVVRPFEWGVEWSAGWPLPGVGAPNGSGPEKYLLRLSEIAIEHGAAFYQHSTPRDFKLHGNRLRFTSPVHTPFPENNVVHGQWFPGKSIKKSVIVLPHWNAPGDAHNALARLFQKFGMSALRLSLPYHDFRMPAELERADYAVSSNIGRTIDATRQAVLDIRCAADWLEQQGAEKIAVVGTSLGSCYAFLASAYDERFRVNVFNHCSTYFADVAWRGLSTQHVRAGLEGVIDLPTLRQLWMCISPTAYFQQFASHPKKSLFLHTKYDTTFPTDLSRETLRLAREYKLDHKEVVLPCGHYTLGESPFKYMDGYHVISFVLRHL